MSVEVDSVTQVNARLNVGKVGEVVNVTSEAALLKTERSEVSDTITQKAVMELPVLGRDMSRLYVLVPGVQASGTTTAASRSGARLDSGARVESRISGRAIKRFIVVSL